MALVVKDRVQETSTTTGTGTFTLAGAVTGFQSFSAIGDGNTTYYAIVGGAEWEVGLGTYTSSGTTLSRDTILESSNGGTAVNFSAGTKNVFVTYPAEKGLYLDASGNAIALGTPASATLTNATGLPISTGVSGLGTGVATFLATPSSANLASAITDETGSGALVFATSPTIASPTFTSQSTFAAGTAAAPSVTTTGDINTGIFFPAADTIAFSEGGTEAMRLDSAGNVGIGTTSPTTLLSFPATTGTAGDANRISLYTSSTNIYGFGISAGQLNIRAGDAGNVVFFTSTSGTATERMRISTAGGLSVGTTADAGAGGIFATANITSYYSSDSRLKENIKDIPNALDKVNHIGGKLFDWTDDYIKSHGGEDGYFINKSDFGVIAQDVKEVFPIAVRERQDSTLAVDYEKLCALAFAAIKELTEKVNKLEAK